MALGDNQEGRVEDGVRGDEKRVGYDGRPQESPVSRKRVGQRRVRGTNESRTDRGSGSSCKTSTRGNVPLEDVGRDFHIEVEDKEGKQRTQKSGTVVACSRDE